MRTGSLAARAAALAGVCLVSAPVAIATAPAAVHDRATTTLAGSAAPATSDNAGLGAVPDSRSQTIHVWMADQRRSCQPPATRPARLRADGARR
jgi:hypothetical protein